MLNIVLINIRKKYFTKKLSEVFCEYLAITSASNMSIINYLPHMSFQRYQAYMGRIHLAHLE
jgi:hypothetical protein